MYSKIISFKILFSFLLLFYCKEATTQVTFEVIKHEINKDKKTIDLFVNALENGKSILPGDKAKDYKVTEIKTAVPTDTGAMSIIGSVEIFGESEFRLLYLIDKSGSMRGDKFREAKAAIKSSLLKYALPDSVASFAYFNESFSSSRIVSLQNFNNVVESVDVEPKGDGKDTHLYYSLQEKIEEWSSFDGRKVIFLLTDGNNYIGLPENLNEPFATGGVAPVTETAILRNVRNLDSLFEINCIGFGEDVDSIVLQKIVAATPNQDDEYMFAATPNDIGSVMQKLTGKQAYNLKLSVRPKDFCEYVGNPRELSIEIMYKGKPVRTNGLDYNYGHSGAGMESFCNTEETKSFLALLGYCLAAIGFLYLLFVLLVPLFSRIHFRVKHIKKYKSVKTTSGELKKDPITTLAFQDQDTVVVNVCKHINLYQSWKDNGNKCGEKNCTDGYANYSNLNFKSFIQQGSNLTRRLNWIWFGGLGGGIGWILYNLFGLIDKSNFSGFYQLITDQGYFDSYHQAMNTGAGLGFGIALTFAFVEENGQSRKLNWGRILFRAFLGLILGGLVFILMHNIFMNVTQKLGIWSHLVSWLVFGLLIAALTSVKSAIELRSALISGLIASLVGWLVYYSMTTNEALIPNKQIGKIFGMITYGALLGVVLDTVRSSLEAFSLDFISPDHARGKRPISKWLKKSDIKEINIGKAPGSYVYIKWNDPVVQPQHASLSYENGKVYIQPKGHTIVNGRTIKTKSPLKDNDIIKLGENSVTTMRFISSKKQKKDIRKSNKKRPAPEIDFIEINSSSQKSTPDGGGITFDI